MAFIDYGGLLDASLLRKCSPAMPGSSCDLAQRRIRRVRDRPAPRDTGCDSHLPQCAGPAWDEKTFKDNTIT
jgi:hypothetical protein